MTPFYVGYLRLPRGLRLPLLVIVGALLLLDAGLAVLVVRAQPAHASGAWGAEGEVTYSGRLQIRPYPVVRVERPDGWRTILLVQEGKHGAPPGLEPLDGKRVSVAGYPILRDDVTVLQLDRPPEAEAGEPSSLPTPSSPVHVTLTGEIVDAKCWTGAMNPGEGKAHKGCGSLCLLGDIPALFIADGPNGGSNWYLMGDAAGGPVGLAARSRVGERLTLTGMVTSGPGLAVFAVDASTLERGS